MNVWMKRRKPRVYRRWGLFIGLLTIFRPPRKLDRRARHRLASRPCHRPDPTWLQCIGLTFTQLEPEVREQLESLRAALATTAKTPGAPGPRWARLTVLRERISRRIFAELCSPGGPTPAA